MGFFLNKNIWGFVRFEFSCPLPCSKWYIFVHTSFLLLSHHDWKFAHFDQSHVEIYFRILGLVKPWLAGSSIWFESDCICCSSCQCSMCRSWKQERYKNGDKSRRPCFCQVTPVSAAVVQLWRKRVGAQLCNMRLSGQTAQHQTQRPPAFPRCQIRLR